MPLFELEQKFALNPALLPLFRLNKGRPPFRHLTHKGISKIHDEYFDTRNILSKNGLYIRKRNGVWEAKSRQNGDFIRSTFYETRSIAEIQALVAKLTTKDRSLEYDFGLERMCKFVTSRETFLADRRFEVVVDEMDFGHWVGEVEVVRRDKEGEEGVWEGIDGFMGRYGWFFEGGGVPKGKITAFFERFGYPKDLD